MNGSYGDGDPRNDDQEDPQPELKDRDRPHPEKSDPAYDHQPSHSPRSQESVRKYAPASVRWTNCKTDRFSVMLRAAGNIRVPSRKELAIHQWKRLVQITSFVPQNPKDDLDDEHCQESHAHFLNPWGPRDRGLRMFRASRAPSLRRRAPCPSEQRAGNDS